MALIKRSDVYTYLKSLPRNLVIEPLHCIADWTTTSALTLKFLSYFPVLSPDGKTTSCKGNMR